MKTSRLLPFISLLGLCSVPALAEVKLPALFTDGAVLQRDREVAIWGWATAGKEVTVTFGSQKKQATAAADGTWLVKLAAMPASAEGREIKASEAGGNEVTVKDVLVGEVWLASGQSNMEWNVGGSREEDKAAATSQPLPLVRMITVPKKVTHERQQDFQGNWRPATPEHVMGFSAVGYFFGRNIHEQVKVPVGIINSSWGGTRIDPWLAEEGFSQVPELAEMARQRSEQLPGQAAYEEKFSTHLKATRQWCDAAEAAAKAKSPMPPQPAPLALLPLQSQTGMYQAMIHPLRNYGVRGFLWYQGESNNGEGMLYFQKMKVLIHGWRQQFGVAEAPFLYVQLAPYTYGSKALPEIWTAQQSTLQVPHTGMAVINDIGNVKDIHPRNKLDVGERLARLAMPPATQEFGRRLFGGQQPCLDQAPDAVIRDTELGCSLRHRQPFAILMRGAVGTNVIDHSHRGNAMRGPGLALTRRKRHAVERRGDVLAHLPAMLRMTASASSGVRQPCNGR